MILYQLSILALLLAFLGLVRRNLRDYQKPEQLMPESTPTLSICIPARNEASNIEECLRGLLNQHYRAFELLVLDDCSEDTTAEIVSRIALEDSRVRLVHGGKIAPGWAGKAYACSQIANLSRGEYILFMDADTQAAPELLGSALAKMESTNADLLSTFPYQITESFWERVVLPMLHFLIITFLPIRQVWESKSPALCAACGQFLLFRREFYFKIGGHESISHSFHDGLQLARRVKRIGGKAALYDASKLIKCRMYAGGQEVWNGFTRNAYEGLGSFGALLLMTLLLGGLFVAPYVFLLIGIRDGSKWTFICLAQIAIILTIRTLQAARFGHWSSLLLSPLSAAAVIAIQWGSFLRSGRHASVTWKGRIYADLEVKY